LIQCAFFVLDHWKSVTGMWQWFRCCY